MIELERKYLWSRLPTCQPTRILKINQFYTLGGLRYREQSDIQTNIKTYFQTFKKESYTKRIGNELFIGRKEIECEITFEDFQRAYNDITNNVVKKTRYIYSDITHVWSGDVFDHSLIKHLIIGELELYSEYYLEKRDKFYNNIKKVIIPGIELTLTNYDISKMV